MINIRHLWGFMLITQYHIVHTQSGLAESFIKGLQLIACTLLFRTQLPAHAWDHAILHASCLIHLSTNIISSIFPILIFPWPPTRCISFKNIWACCICLYFSSQWTKMGTQRRLRSYVSFKLSYTIRYLEPMISDLFTVHLSLLF